MPSAIACAHSLSSSSRLWALLCTHGKCNLQKRRKKKQNNHMEPISFYHNSVYLLFWCPGKVDWLSHLQRIYTHEHKGIACTLSPAMRARVRMYRRALVVVHKKSHAFQCALGHLYCRCLCIGLFVCVWRALRTLEFLCMYNTFDSITSISMRSPCWFWYCI